jgi:hypothetical protein
MHFKQNLSLLFLMTTAALIAVYASAQQQPRLQSSATSPAQTSRLPAIAEYLKWRRVNPKPVMMDVEAAMRCMGPTAEQAKRVAGSPHFPKYITVYVNKAGQEAMLLERIPHFPVGTVIVKEKRTLPTDKTPELMTVMIKQQAGYDTAHGDWEYAVMNASGKIQAQGKLATCQNCHDQQKRVDYVFKGYVPNGAHTGRIALETFH